MKHKILAGFLTLSAIAAAPAALAQTTLAQTLRVPGDAREAHSHGGAEPVDIFLLKFRKPG